MKHPWFRSKSFDTFTPLGPWIERITLTHVRVPLVEPFKISNGEVSEKDGIIVAVHSEGIVGYGEASPMSGAFYSADTPESTWECLKNEIVPLIQREKPQSIEEISTLLERIRGNSFAKAGIETAFWDLEAQKQSLPLFRLLGGNRSAVESGLAVGIYPNIDKLLQAIERYLSEGYKRVKIKIQPGWDIEPLLAVRGEFGRISLMVDANCAYTQSDLEHLQALDDFDLMMIEQPLSKDDLEGHAKLQSTIQTPVCLDEGAQDIAAVEHAARLGSCKIVNIKIQRVGGLKAAKEMHDACVRHGIPVWGGTMPELGIGGAQTIHLATLGNFTFPTDVESSSRWFVEDIIDPPIEVKQGVIAIPDGHGNAYRLNDRTVKKYTIRKEIF